MTGKVAVIGCGAIGRPWAIVFARAGYQVALWGRSGERVARALAAIDAALPELAALGLLADATPAEVRGRIGGATTLEAALAGVLHVQENVPEALAVKRAMFAALDARTAPDVPIASSSSGTPPSAFTEELEGRARCLVAHPINPPHLIPAVEIVPAPWTDPAVVEQTHALMRAAGQAPITLARETPGFVFNRLQGALLNEAFRLVEDGFASPEEVDLAVAQGLGLRWSFMGPFETVDLNMADGIAGFARRFAGMFHEVAKLQAAARPWAPETVAAVEATRRRVLPAGAIAARQAWRDQRLAELAAHKRRAQREIGN